MYVYMLSTFSNIFSSEILGQIERPWKGGTKICSNGSSHGQDGHHAHIW